MRSHSDESAEGIETRWQSLLSHSADAAVIADAATNLITWVSPAAIRMFGWQPAELIGRSGRSLVHPDDVHLMLDALKVVTADPTTHATVEIRVVCPDGSFRWVEETISNQVVEPGVQGLVANIRDISARRHAQEALRSSEARYRLIAETAQEGIWATDPQGKTLYANQKMADLLGFPLTEFYEQRSDKLISGVTRAQVRSRQRRRGSEAGEKYELLHTRPDGATRVLGISASPLVDDARYLGSLAMITDITAARQAENELVYRATHDPLTGLANRALLLDRVQESLDAAAKAGQGSTAVLVADIDQFKLVNDSYGHAAGDDLLVEVTRRWEGAVRSDDLIGRFGGDEFVVLCSGASEDVARARAARLLATLTAPIDLEIRSVNVTASIGVAVSAAGDLTGAPDASTLLRFADAAMYEAKAQGRGRIVAFTPSLIERAQSRLRLFNDLKEAIEQDQLRLHYQPVVELITGRLLGLEALCRWTHPVRGEVPPIDFVPMAEETGLIGILDDWVLRRACRDAAAMRKRGILPRDGYIAVNVSAGNLSQDGFELMVRDLLLEHELPARALVLEVTESALMRDADAARVVLENLQAIGVAVAIDDFGTGYSSLAYLRRFPVATLKIDRSFVQHLTDSGEDRAIVRAIADLARALGVDTTAEGIESVSELALLQQLGCLAGQGYLWSPAVCIDDLAALLGGLTRGRFAVLTPRSTSNSTSSCTASPPGLVPDVRSPLHDVVVLRQGPIPVAARPKVTPDRVLRG